MLSTKIQKYRDELLRKGRAEGLAEARAEGRLESHREVAKVLLEAQFGDEGRRLWPQVEAEGSPERLAALVRLVGLGRDLDTVRAEVWPEPER